VKIAKKTAAVVVMVLSAVTLLLALGGVIVTWVVAPPIKRDVVVLLTNLEKPLTVAENALSAVNARTAQARSGVAVVDDTINQLRQKVIDTNLALELVQATLGKKVGPGVVAALDTASYVAESVVAVNSTLETLNRIPGVSVPTLTPQLTTIRSRTSEAMTAVQELQAQIQEFKSGLVGDAVGAVTTRTAKIDGILSEIQSSAEGYEDEVAQVRAKVVGLQSSIPRTITIAAILMTVLFLVGAAGQVALFKDMLDWFNRV